MDHLPENYINEDGQDIPVFDEDGMQVPRRRPIYDGDDTYGVIAHLPRARSLFDTVDPFDGNAYPDDDEYNSGIGLEITTYPQAFTRDLGFFQCNRVPYAFHRYIHAVNHDVVDPRYQHEGLEAYGNGTRTIRFTRQALNPVSTQGYNTCVHRGRGAGDHHHLVQHGIITAAIAGTYSTTPQNVRRAKTLAEQIWNPNSKTVGNHSQFPHARTNARLASATNESFRLEVNYFLDVQAMDPRYRNGL